MVFEADHPGSRHSGVEGGRPGWHLYARYPRWPTSSPGSRRTSRNADSWIFPSSRASRCSPPSVCSFPPDGARTPDEARAAAVELGGTVVVKAQVQVGGRGKAGGIKLAANAGQAAARAADILGMDIRATSCGSCGWRRPPRSPPSIMCRSSTAGTQAPGHGVGPRWDGHRGGRRRNARRPRATPYRSGRRSDELAGIRTGVPSRARSHTARKSAAMLQSLYRAFVTLDCDLGRSEPSSEQSQGRSWRSMPR